MNILETNMNINASLFMQCVVFLTLAGFVMKYVWPPLIKAIDERRQQIADGLAAAERGNREQLEAQDQAKLVVDGAKAQAAEIIAIAQKRASETIDQSKIDAKEEGNKQLSVALEQIDLERNRARETLRKQIVTLSVAGASRVISKEIDEKTHAKLLEDLVAQL